MDSHCFAGQEFSVSASAHLLAYTSSVKSFCRLTVFLFRKTLQLPVNLFPFLSYVCPLIAKKAVVRGDLSVSTDKSLLPNTA